MISADKLSQKSTKLTATDQKSYSNGFSTKPAAAVDDFCVEDLALHLYAW